MAERLDRGIPLPPVDLLAVAVVGLWLATVPVVDAPGNALRVALGLTALFFAPGYALVSALSPAAWTETATTGPLATPRREPEITGIERIVVAVGLSVCTVPLVGLGLNYTPWGVNLNLIASLVGIATVVLAAVAVVRRWQLPPYRRFTPELPTGALAGGRDASRSTAALNVLLVAGLVIAAGGIGLAATQADQGEQFTEFYLLAEDDDGGNLVAENYPETVLAEGSEPVYVGIENREGERTTYTVVVLLQRFETVEGESVVQEQRTIDRVSVTLEDGQTRHLRREIEPALTGEDLRVTYQLYEGEAPDDPRRSEVEPYREAHIWIDVPAPDA